MFPSMLDGCVESWLRAVMSLTHVAQAVAKLQQLVDRNFIYNPVDLQTRAFADDGDLWRFWQDGTAPPLNVKVAVWHCFTL
jgi:hypothetical protein